MYLIQIGRAAEPPVSLPPKDFGLSNPTHTTATCLGLNPANQASIWLLVVPVLPAKSLRPSCRAFAAVPIRVTSSIIDVMR